MAITPGMVLKVTTAGGDHVLMRALSEPTRGRDMPVVWVCTEADYEAAMAGDESVRIPWPLDAVVDEAVPA
jgi:hypothetical protein